MGKVFEKVSRLKMERTRNWENFNQWKIEKCQSNIMKWTYEEFGKYT